MRSSSLGVALCLTSSVLSGWAAPSGFLLDDEQESQPPLVLSGSAAPSAPTDLTCRDWSGVAGPGELFAQVHVDPQAVDMVSFMVARVDDDERWPFLHFSVKVGLYDMATVRGLIPGLEPGADYRVMARAHARGQTTAYYIFWSDVAHREAPCRASDHSAAASAASEAPVVDANATTNTVWMEVFRHNGNNKWATPDPKNNITLPDYIEAHNTGDIGGVFTNRHEVVYAWEDNSSFTRYCVEMQVVELNDVTTPTDRPDRKEAGGFPTTSQFADYNSCSGGNCVCMNYGDRSFRQPKAQLEAECPGCSQNECVCNCPAERLAQSAQYIGMVPTNAHVEHGEPVIDGRWFSMPPASLCPPGARIGEHGCTYRVSPISHSISLGNLHKKGVFSWRPWRRAKQYKRIARAAFDDLGIKPCGESYRPGQSVV